MIPSKDLLSNIGHNILFSIESRCRSGVEDGAARCSAQQRQAHVNAIHHPAKIHVDDEIGIFGGELVCTRSIDLKEKKEAVNRALSDLGWNFATLRQVIERAAQAKPNDITNEQFWDDLVSMSGLNGLAGDALALISGVKSGW